MSTDFIARLLGMVLFAVAGALVGADIGELGFGPLYLSPVILGLLGALIGLVLTPIFTTRPVRLLKKQINLASSQTFLTSLLGLFLGLVIAALLSYPLSLLPAPFGKYLPAIAAVLFAYYGVVLFAFRQEDVLMIIPGRGPADSGRPEGQVPEQESQGPMILLDTSVIIDGRIEDIAKTGFLPGNLWVPNFILNELQYIADSADDLRRQRGRRGMNVLTNLRKEPNLKVIINDADVEGVDAVDDKLVALARRTGSQVLTNDYNLNRIADLQGVRILNINELANAVKAVFLPGEELEVEIIQEGKEHGQGVGYLEDGTMIVVENGSRFLGETVPTVVTKVLQTAAGRMIFSRPENNQRER